MVGTRAAKTAAIERLRTRYRRMRDSRWRGYRAYDAWFDAPAKLAAISFYSDQVTAFLRLFNLCSGDYPRFYASVQQLGKLDKANRERQIHVIVLVKLKARRRSCFLLLVTARSPAFQAEEKGLSR